MNIPQTQQTQTRFFSNIYKRCVTEAAPKIPFDGLEHGTRILRDEAECIRYIALYGGHHFHKLYAAFDSTKLEELEGKNIQIIDWGCGQALATCILIDYLIERTINPNILSITLIEPSQIAVNRGHSLINEMLQNDGFIDLPIKIVNQKIADLTCSDLVSVPECTKIHLFSNIIDIQDVDLEELCTLIAGSFQGINYMLCTSPSGQSRLQRFHYLFSRNHVVTDLSSSNDHINGEVYLAKSQSYEDSIVARCEELFIVNLT